MEEADAAAVTRAREGDHDAFRALVERHSRRLFQLAYRMTGSEQDAEDVVQETFLRAYRQLGRFQSRANFSTWLHRIAVNCCFDLLRKRQREDRQTDSLGQEVWEEVIFLAAKTPAPDQQAFDAEMKQHITSALNLLTPKERAAFILRHFEEKSIEEIGGMLDLGASATKQSIFRAVQKMRRALDPIVNPGQPT